MSENKDQNRAISIDSGVADEALEAITTAEMNGTNDATAAEDTTVEAIDKILIDADPKFGETLKNIQANASELNKADLSSVVVEKKIDGAKLKKQFKSVKFWMVTVAILIFVFFGLFLIWKNPIRFLNDQLFITSYANFGNEVHEFDTNEDNEAFYDNPRFTKNLISISRMIVNIKPSESSGSNPMLAIEVNAEGISPEATIELKDREAEFKDILIRQAEEFTYDELITTIGKQNICDQFRLVINANLTKGQIRKVFLKSFIIKP